MTTQEAKDQVAKNHYYSSWDLLCRNGNHTGTPDAWIDEVCQLFIKEMDDKILETQVANTSIDLLNSELSSKEQECAVFEKSSKDWFDAYQDLAAQFVHRGDELLTREGEIERLRAENERLTNIISASLRDDNIEILRKRCEDLEAGRKAIMFNAWTAARNYDFIENIQCAISELDKTEFEEWYKLLSQ